jgi:hypothetical protein
MLLDPHDENVHGEDMVAFLRQLGDTSLDR